MDSLKINCEISFLPVAEAGGLEFDVAIVTDIERYNRRKIEEARLLYTAITRAVHHLYLFSETTKTKGDEIVA